MKGYHKMELKTKKPRQPAHVWTRFFNLGPLQLFYVGKEVWQRDGWFTARSISGLNNAGLFRWPWTRVRTLQLVNPKRAFDAVKVADAAFNRSLDCGQTHYVGDGCQPPHPEFEQTGPSA